MYSGIIIAAIIIKERDTNTFNSYVLYTRVATSLLLRGTTT